MSALHDNQRRAERALSQVEGYGEGGSRCDDCLVEQWVSDLLCDLRHLADVRGFDWHRLCARGDRHYLDECQEEQAEARASRLASPHVSSVGRRTEEGRALWSGRCCCGWESPAVYGSAGAALDVCQEHVRQAREASR